MLTRECYLCGSSSTRVVVANPRYSYKACGSCGFRMQFPLPSGDDDEELYGDDFYAERKLERGLDEQDVVARGLIDGRVRMITTLNGMPGDVLDIGAGTGLFVEAATRAGWRAEGIETSAAAVRIAARITRATIGHQRLEEVERDGAFDVVTLWDVLEHMPDPRASLGRIARLLKGKGLVAISLPNVGGFKSRMSGTRWRYYRREFGHISHFSPATLTKLLEQAGFRPVLVRTSGFFNLGKPFRMDPAGVRANPVLGRLQSVADRGAGLLAAGEDLVVVGRRSTS